ncbi:hypothetical protein [uncultured Oscillibacter sp.]|uniref:hypothetical protein n=1 Tax=uncultured Oscillibacter sp. TaxID=876091 RepID=UPI0025F632ED|nr:hypothetical protein [uncultured Oscillibacter sp.]
MVSKKITIGAVKAVKTIYINGNVKATGGKREINVTHHDCCRKIFINNPFCTEDSHVVDKVRGCYYKKNAFVRLILEEIWGA